MPGDHPDAVPDTAAEAGEDGPVRALNSPEAVLVAVAGANNAGISTVIEAMGPRGHPPAVTKVADVPGPAGA